MARKDRRFTGEDVLRFYCVNISKEQRAFVLAQLESCGEEAVDWLPDALRILAEIVALIPVPGAGLIGQSLVILADAVDQSFTDEQILEYLGAPDDYLPGMS